uniref:Uncharacterized protein n=1 Tax=Glossina palpalis gambiensis TaxID=67801 RepID=A0A1B0BQL1_9MUSC
MSAKNVCVVFADDEKATNRIEMDLSEDLNGFQCRQASHSSLNESSENDLSFALSTDDVEVVSKHADVLHADELPPSEIADISPVRCENRSSSFRTSNVEHLIGNGYQDVSEFVNLQDVNASIISSGEQSNAIMSLRRAGSLETIFEGVLLNTSPRRRRLGVGCRSCTLIRNGGLHLIEILLAGESRTSNIAKDRGFIQLPFVNKIIKLPSGNFVATAFFGFAGCCLGGFFTEAALIILADTDLALGNEGDENRISYIKKRTSTFLTHYMQKV